MSDVAASVCDINTMVGKLNRVVRQTHGCDIKELEKTVDAIETFAKQIKEWCATKQ
jgi:hypothetical protein